MVTGGWSYILAAYALTLVSLGGLTLVVVLRATYWRKLAKRQARADSSPKEK